MDSSILGQYAAAMMEQISADFGEDCTIRTIAIAAEVDDGPSTSIIVFCSEDRAWVRIAFVQEALWALEDRLQQLQDAAEEDD